MALDFIAGCLGGCAGVIVGHPLDTIKVKLQTQDYKNPIYKGTWNCFTSVLKTENVAGVYRGVFSPMAGVALVNAIVFGVYGNMQRNLTEPGSLWPHFVAGATAGVAQSIVSSPVELVKTRMQTNSQYKSTWDCFLRTLKHEGARGVFKGLSITGVREFLSYGSYFTTYEVLTRTSPGEAPVGIGVMLLAGGMSSTVSWLLTYPLDVVKSRFQADIGTYSNMTHCFKISLQNEGLSFLTKGLTPTVIRAFPTNAVTFTVVTCIMSYAHFTEKHSAKVKDVVQSMLETLQNEKHVLNNVQPMQESIKNFEINNILKRQPFKYFTVSEDLWVNGEYGEFFNESVSESLFNHKKNLGGNETPLEVNLEVTEIKTFNDATQHLNENNYCDVYFKAVQTREEYEKWLR